MFLQINTDAQIAELHDALRNCFFFTDAVVSVVASQQEGVGFDPSMFSPCLLEFHLGTPVSSHNPKR